MQIVHGGIGEGELELLAASGATKADPNIRQELRSEVVKQGKRKSYSDTVLFWRGRKGDPGTPLDANEEAVRLARLAVAAGLPVTAEVTPHHLILTEDLVSSYDPLFKVNPPLRTHEDTLALREAVADGTIDIVATDHAPHAEQDKCCEFAAARPGMLGLETALSIIVQTMVQPGLLDWRGVARVMSERPAAIVGLDDQLLRLRERVALRGDDRAARHEAVTRVDEAAVIADRTVALADL